MPDPEKSVYEHLNTWIYNRCKSSSTIVSFVGTHPNLNKVQIYEGAAPQGSPKPFLVFIFAGGSPRRGNAGRKIFDKVRVIIKFIIEGDSLKPVMAPMVELENLFQQGQDANDTEVIGCSIVGNVNFNETVDGIRRSHIGYEVEFFLYNDAGLNNAVPI